MVPGWGYLRAYVFRTEVIVRSLMHIIVFVAAHTRCVEVLAAG